MLWQEKFPSNFCRHLISLVLQTFLYGTNELFNHLFLSVLENSQSAVNGLSLSLSVSVYYFFYTFSSSLFRNLFPSSLSQHPCIRPYSAFMCVYQGAFWFFCFQ